MTPLMSASPGRIDENEDEELKTTTATAPTIAIPSKPQPQPQQQPVGEARTTTTTTTTKKTSPPPPPLDKVESCARQLEDGGRLLAANDSSTTTTTTTTTRLHRVKRDNDNNDNDDDTDEENGGRSSSLPTPPKKPRLSPLRPRSPPQQQPPAPAGGGGGGGGEQSCSNPQQGGPEVVDLTFDDDDDDDEKKDNKDATAAAAVEKKKEESMIAGTTTAAGPPLPPKAPAVASSNAATTTTSTTTSTEKKKTIGHIHRFLVEIPPHVQRGQKLQVVHPTTGRTMGVTVPLLSSGKGLLVKEGKRYMVVVTPEAFPPLPPPPVRSRGRGGRTSPSSSKTTTNSVSPEGAEGTRRSGRRRRQTEVLTIDHDTLNEYGKARIRVGRKYQAIVPGWGEEQEGGDDDEGDRYEQIWDPIKYDEVKDDPLVIEFLVKTVPCHQRDLGYLALHNANYDAKLAPQMFQNLTTQTTTKSNFSKNDRMGRQLTSQEKEAFEEAILKQVEEDGDDTTTKEDNKKNFRTISRQIGCSVNSCLLHYYGTFKSTPAYKELKMKLAQSYQDCEVCEDGGDLLVCESCHKCWHLQCLDPPLLEVPEGDWYCANCERKKQREQEGKCWTTSSSPVSPALAGARTHGGSSSPSSSSSSPFPVIELPSKKSILDHHRQQNNDGTAPHVVGQKQLREVANELNAGHGGSSTSRRRVGGSSSKALPAANPNGNSKKSISSSCPYSKTPIWV